LKQVQSFDDAQRGERPGGFSPNYKIYEGLLNSRPLISISKYSSLVDNGSPAAKLYAAMLINAQDGAAGKAAFQKLSTDKSRVSFVSGCCAIEVTVKEIADDFLDKGNYMHFQLPRPAIK
jgi:hypothetical protein